MQQRPLQEVARLANIAIAVGYPVEAGYETSPENDFDLINAEYEKDETGEHIYGYDKNGTKHCIGNAKLRQYSPNAVPFIWNAAEGCSW
jgi:hypothetical protein